MVRRADTRSWITVVRMERVRTRVGGCRGLVVEFIKRMQARQIMLLVRGVRRDLAGTFRSTGLEARLGPEQIFRETPSVWSSTLEAIRHAYQLLGSDLCSTCPRRNETANEKGSWDYMI